MEGILPKTMLLVVVVFDKTMQLDDTMYLSDVSLA
jgi:hypothetical protein